MAACKKNMHPHKICRPALERVAEPESRCTSVREKTFLTQLGAANGRDERRLFVPFLPSLNLAGIRWSSSSKAACKTVPTQQLKVSRKNKGGKRQYLSTQRKHCNRGNELNRRPNLRVKKQQPGRGNQINRKEQKTAHIIFPPHAGLIFSAHKHTATKSHAGTLTRGQTEAAASSSGRVTPLT